MLRRLFRARPSSRATARRAEGLAAAEVQALEERTLLTAVSVAGTAGDDAIEVAVDGPDLVVRVNAAEANRTALADVTALSVDGGDGNDAITVTGPLALSGANATFTAESFAVAAGGGVSTGGGSFRVTAGGSIVNRGAVDTGGGRLTLRANDQTFAVGSSLTAGAGGEVNLRVNSGGVSIDLGGADAAGRLGLTAAELATITDTGTLTLTAAADYVVSDAVDLTGGVTTLHLDGGQNVSQSAGATLAVSRLVSSARGAVALTDAGNDFDSVSVSSADAVSVADADDLTVLAAGAGSGDLALAAADLRLDAAVLSAAGAVTLTGAVTLLRDAAVASGGGGTVTFDGTVDGGSVLRVSTGGDARFAGDVGIADALGSLIVNEAAGFTHDVTFEGGLNYGRAFVQSGGRGTTTFGGGAVPGPFWGDFLAETGAVVIAGGTFDFGGEATATADFAAAGAATLRFDLAGPSAGGNDRLGVTGAVDLGGAALDLNTAAGYAPAAGTVFTLVENDGTDAVVGTFAGLAEGALIDANGTELRLSYAGGDGNDVTLTAHRIPETLTVDLLTDESDGDYSAGNLTLREALGLANRDADANTVVFAPALAGGTLTLTGGAVRADHGRDGPGPRGGRTDDRRGRRVPTLHRRRRRDGHAERPDADRRERQRRRRSEHGRRPRRVDLQPRHADGDRQHAGRQRRRPRRGDRQPRHADGDRQHAGRQRRRRPRRGDRQPRHADGDRQHAGRQRRRRPRRGDLQRRHADGDRQHAGRQRRRRRRRGDQQS